LIRKYREKGRSLLQEFLSENTTPHSIAIGAAIGTFIAVLPTLGFTILLGLLAMLVYPKANKLALFASFVFWNPITLIPLYMASYSIGDALFGSQPVIRYNVIILDQIYNFSRRFLIGNFIIAIASSLLVYVLVRSVMFVYRKRRKSRSSRK